MKNLFKVFTLVFALSLFANANLFGQSGVIKLNILSPIVSTLNLSYEHMLSEDRSAQLGFFYTGASIGDTKLSGIGITPEYRIYLGDDPAPDGFYVAPFLRYQNFKLSSDFDNSEGTYSSFGVGLIVGRQWLFGERVTFDIFLGPSYSFGNVEVTDGNDNFDLGGVDGFGLRTGITLGFAF